MGENSAEQLRGWGWVLRDDGTWFHEESGGVGEVTNEHTLINRAEDASFDFNDYRDNPDTYTPGTVKHDAAGEETNRSYSPPSPTSTPSPGDSSYARPSDGFISELNSWGWYEQPDGTWLHKDGEKAYFSDSNTMVSPGAGVTFHVDRYLAGQDDHTTQGVSQEAARKSPWGNDIRPGEFLEPWSEQFSFGPAPDPFSYAPGEHGYQPFNEQFDWDPKGDMPRPDPGFIPELNSWGWYEQPDGTWLHKDGDSAHFVNGTTMVSTTGDKTFHVDRYLAGRDDHTEEGISELHSQFDPSEYGYQPFNEQFSFDADDLYKDPGYQFRFDQGNKAIERKAASRGFLQSGRTLKSLGQFSQGLASQEYGAAYQRSRGEHGMADEQSRAAYGRKLGEFGIAQDQSQDAYDREFGEWGAQYGMYGDAYNRDWQEYLNKRGEWESNRDRRFNTLLTLSGV